MQPAWSARHVKLPANQVKTVLGNIDHMFMMEYDDTLNGHRRGAVMKSKLLPEEHPFQPASSEEAIAFIRKLWRSRGDKTQIQQDLKQLTQSMIRRIMMDIMKGPGGRTAAGNVGEVLQGTAKRASAPRGGERGSATRRSRRRTERVDKKLSDAKGSHVSAVDDRVTPRTEVAAARQRWATDGITAMQRPGVVARLVMALAAFAERLNLRYARLGSPCIYDNSIFPWAAEIERQCPIIRRELDRILPRRDELPNVQEIAQDAASITQDHGWKIFVLTAYGIRARRNIALCPETWRIVRQIPGLKTAMFSIFEPGKRLPPHRGPYNGVLRLHLGLLIPEPHARQGMRVGNEHCTWQEGRVLIFDDAYEHEAWNETAGPRIVLFVDFIRPVSFPANLLNRLLLALAVFTPYLREAHDNLRNWEQRFHRDSDVTDGQRLRR